MTDEPAYVMPERIRTLDPDTAQWLHHLPSFFLEPNLARRTDKHFTLYSVTKLFNLYEINYSRGILLPSKKAVREAFKKYDDNDGTWTLGRRHFTPAQKAAVKTSRIYNSLQEKSAIDGSYTGINGTEFASLVLWGGDEFFDILDIEERTFSTGSKEKMLFAKLEDHDKFAALLASDWRTDQPLDISEAVMTMLPFWAQRGLELFDDDKTMKDWLPALSDPVMRGILARREFVPKYYDMNVGMEYLVNHHGFGYNIYRNGGTILWFILKQMHYQAEDTDGMDNTYAEDWSDVVEHIQNKCHAFDIAPYLSAGVHPSVVLGALANGVDIELALSISV